MPSVAGDPAGPLLAPRSDAGRLGRSRSPPRQNVDTIACQRQKGKEITVGSATKSFAKLKEQVDQAAQTVAAAASEDEKAVQAKLDEARKDADARAATCAPGRRRHLTTPPITGTRSGPTGISTSPGAASAWTMQSNQLDVTAAVQDAQWAENDAIDAIDFASAAITEAEYAVLDAVRARQNAEALSGASV